MVYLSTSLRADLRCIASCIAEGERLLDIGCGAGELLLALRDERRADVRGMDISDTNVQACLKAGLRAVQGDAECDLQYYTDGFFDTVIAGELLQTTGDAKHVLDAMLRIGKRVIVSTPNFGHWRNRAQLGFLGKMPVTSQLSYQWYDTPNIHFSTAKDFTRLAKLCGCRVASAFYISGDTVLPSVFWPLANLLAERAVFVLEKKSSS